mgnify:CR=1 FL=1
MKKKFKVLNIEHIAIAVKSIDNAKIIFEDVLGMSSFNKEVVDNEQVVVKKIIGENKCSKIELLESTNKLSPVAKFIDNRGEGIHHIALEVDDIHNAIDYLKYKNYKLIYDRPQKGADNKLITFIHPSSLPGILLELCQKQ